MNENIQFPHIEHRVYKNTFLQNTIVEVTYDKVSPKQLTGDFEDNKNLFFKRFFNIDQSQRDFIKDGISLATADKSQSLTFTDCNCKAIVNRSVYNTFVESILQHVFEISKFLQDVVRLREVSSIAVRKINMFPVIYDESRDLSIRTERQKVLANVFTSNFISLHHEENVLPVKGAVAPFGVRKIKGPDGVVYTLKTGIIPPQDENKDVLFVVLDSEAELGMNTNTQDIESKALKLNDYLFDLYHWAVSKEIIDRMQQE